MFNVIKYAFAFVYVMRELVFRTVCAKIFSI